MTNKSNQKVIDLRDSFNSIYIPLLHSKKRRKILYGGRDTGKSHLTAQALLIDCMRLSYFKCVLVRKYYKTVKESQWSKLMSVAKDMGIYDKFTFLKSPLEIIYKENPNNRFIAMGMDEPDKAKSLDDPTHAWYEEVDQIKEDDFDTFTLSLRNSKGISTSEWLTFNAGNPKHWLVDRFFPDPKTFEKKDGLHTKVPSTDDSAVIIHACYKHNDYITEDRVKEYERIKARKPKTYKVKGLGLFGRDKEGALWSDKLIDENRVDFHPDLYRLCVAMDPSASNKKDSDEAGIILAGKSYDGHYYVLHDSSAIYSPKEQGSEAIHLLKRTNADAIVIEKNNGGDWIPTTLIEIDKTIESAIEMVWASRGKATRAEPIVNLYEMGLVHHVNVLEELESEMTEWIPKEGSSPNRLDALVWAITWLMNDTIDKSGFYER